MKYMLYKKIKNIYYDIESWMWYNSPIYINFNIFSLWREWFTARKIFRAPKYLITFYKEKIFNRQCKHNWFSCIVVNLGWKWKWNETRYETNPRLIITLFNKYSMHLELIAPIISDRGYTKDMEYWETILSYLYMYNKDFEKAFNYFGWITFKETDNYTYDISCWDWGMITYKAQLKYKKLLKKDIVTNINPKN